MGYIVDYVAALVIAIVLLIGVYLVSTIGFYQLLHFRPGNWVDYKQVTENTYWNIEVKTLVLLIYSICAIVDFEKFSVFGRHFWKFTKTNLIFRSFKKKIL